MEASRRYGRAADVLWRRAGGLVLLLPLEAEDVFQLGGTGPAVWDVLAEPRTVAEAAAVLAARYAVPAARIAADIEPVLDDLVRRGAVSVVAGA